jgi:hypothetical protein
MSSQKKKSSGHGSTPKGDHEHGLNPSIPFVPPKVDGYHDKEKYLKEVTTVTIPRRRHSRLLMLTQEMELSSMWYSLSF